MGAFHQPLAQIGNWARRPGNACAMHEFTPADAKRHGHRAVIGKGEDDLEGDHMRVGVNHPRWNKADDAFGVLVWGLLPRPWAVVLRFAWISSASHLMISLCDCQT